MPQEICADILQMQIALSRGWVKEIYRFEITGDKSAVEK